MAWIIQCMVMAGHRISGEGRGRRVGMAWQITCCECSSGTASGRTTCLLTTGTWCTGPHYELAPKIWSTAGSIAQREPAGDIAAQARPRQNHPRLKHRREERVALHDNGQYPC